MSTASHHSGAHRRCRSHQEQSDADHRHAPLTPSAPPGFGFGQLDLLGAAPRCQLLGRPTRSVAWPVERRVADPAVPLHSICSLDHRSPLPRPPPAYLRDLAEGAGAESVGSAS
ncbi:MAG: hypothetical protein M0Z82_17035 [Actinomycetota bacterium]|nr:hypothetical protein [Actinomycetota bacterium]